MFLHDVCALHGYFCAFALIDNRGPFDPLRRGDERPHNALRPPAALGACTGRRFRFRAVVCRIGHDYHYPIP